MESENLEYDNHPNWVALATVHIPYKRFIKAASTDVSPKNNFESKNEITINASGPDIKNFYETLTQTSKNNIGSVDKINLRKYCHSNDTKPRNVTKIDFDKNKFFRAATANDLETLKSFKFEKDLINSTDHYGWSALMMASCENAFDAAKFLLCEGARKDIRDKKGNDASTLSRNKGFTTIENLIKTFKNKKLDSAKDMYIEKKVKVKTFKYFCTLCDREFNVKNKKEHETSTIHLFNTKNEKRSGLRYSTISNRNRGLKLMVKQGWDRESGLGPTGSGNLFPIKTVIRKNRTGLGTEQDSAKVTHFKPYDLNAIKYKAPLKLKSRNEMRKEQQRNRKIERRLRKELS